MRTIDPTLLAALESDSVELYYAVEMLFDSGAVRLWTGIGTKTIAGQTYTGAGTLLGISGMEESGDLAANGASITLSGVDSGLVSLALAEPYQNRVCNIYLGSGANATKLFSGLMDVIFIQDSGDTCIINLTVESRVIVLERMVPRRYTQESQESRFPGDLFFSYVTDLADKQITWGRDED